MNFLIKFQSSPGVAVEVLLKNSKHSCPSCFCRDCFRWRLQRHQNAQESSTYLSPYKLLLVKKNVLKENGDINPDVKAEALDKLTNTVEPNKKNTGLKKENTSYHKINEAFSLKTTFINGSSESYNSDLIHNNLKAEKLFDKYNRNSIPKRNESFAQVAISDDTQTERQFKRSSTKKSDFVQEISDFNRSKVLRMLNLNNVNEKILLKKHVEKLTPYIQEKDEEPPDKYYWPNISEVEKKDIFKGLMTIDKEEERQDFKNFTLSLSFHESFIEYLQSSADILITSNKLMEAFDLFEASRKRKFWKYLVKQQSKSLVYAYNILLNGLSDQGEWDLVKIAVEWMNRDNIKLIPESFAAILHCLATIRPFRSEEFMEEEVCKIVKQLFANNVSLDDIFSESKLGREKTEKILSVLQIVMPFFNIKPITVNLNSNCPLTRNLYDSSNTLKSPVENLEIDYMEELVEEQLLLEKKFLIDIKAVSSKRLENESHETEYKVRLEKYKKEWKNSLRKAVIKAIKDGPNSGKNTEVLKLHTYMSCLPVESLVEILVKVVDMLVKYSGSYSPEKAHISRFIGYKIAERYQIKKKELVGVVDVTDRSFKQYVSWYLDPRGPAQNSRQAWQMLNQDSENSALFDLNTVKWPFEVVKKLGKFFLDIIIKEVKFSDVRTMKEVVTYPVFYTVLRCHSHNWREEIKCHPNMSSLFDKVPLETLTFRADEMPMVCPPKPWKNACHGGYLILSTEFIRKPSTIFGKVIEFDKVPAKFLYPTLDALNALQMIPWRVNEDVLDVALKVFREGGSEELNVPDFPSEKLPEFQFAGLSSEERWKFIKNRNEIKQKNANKYSLWCEALYRLSLVNHFRKRMFWLPQNCDFRGRVYPVPSLLNHIGGDLFRSLLVFAQGKPLGPKGLDWLKIHVINLTGTHKKKSVEERLAYANEILPEILDSAEKPLTGRKWWAKSDDPWQTLAGCMEIKKALSHPDPSKYVSGFPIHQDGSCNGLQHYAALGRDVCGARSVNLASLKEPQDVYSVVAELIEEERRKDAENGVEIAKTLEGFIHRKVVKQTVMTTVYGVTHFGAKIQIRRKLEEIPDFPQHCVHSAASYLSNKVFSCIRQMFTSAKKIQNWFNDCTHVIANKKDYVQWRTPLGLPVVQHYGKYRRNDEVRMIIVPNSYKQRNSFPPNFIHTLDSCHMMLTALYCEQAGISFAAVHDCFWTHPCSVDKMNVICREQFISLHSQPILEDLSQFFKEQYLENYSGKNKGYSAIFEAVPDKGNFDLQEVKNSVYFFC